MLHIDEMRRAELLEQITELLSRDGRDISGWECQLLADKLRDFAKDISK